MAKKEMTPEEMNASKERKGLILVVFSGTVLYTLIGTILALGWNIFATVCGIVLIIFSVSQLIWILAHKNLSNFEKKFFMVVNFIPYLIYSFTTY